MTLRNSGIAEVGQIAFRIGVHQGDIVVEDRDIFGDGVNVAARFEGMAEPGGICVSARVQEDVAGRLDVDFDDLGDQNLKNITRPVRIYRVRNDNDVTQPVKPALPLPEKPSIAVLPFQNMSADAEQEYFADGMVEEITTALSRIPWLFVIARNSSFTYKGKAVDVKQIALELGVRYVLEGSVRKSVDRVRITGQLIDTSTGAHIWADRFDGALDDVFDLQDQVASSVAGAIEPKLRQSEIDRANRKPTQNLDAYDLYLRALAGIYRYSEEGFDEANGTLLQALTLDPSYARAAALLAWSHHLRRTQAWRGVDIDFAVRLARQALDLARDDPDSLWQAGFTLFMLADETDLAATVTDRALLMNPNSASALATRGYICALRYQPEQAIQSLEQALRLSPFDPLEHFITAGIGVAHLTARRFQLAIEWAERSLHDQPRSAIATRLKICALAHLDRLEEARAVLVPILAASPGLTIAGFKSYARSFAPEVMELYVTGLRLAGLPEQ
jgi:TolB-like protein